MLGDHSKDALGKKAERAPLKTHEFRRDPFERLRSAGSGVRFVALNAFSKRAAIVVGAVVIATGALVGAGVLGASGPDAPPAASAQDRSLAEREAKVKQGEQRLADLERRRAAAESEISDGEKRIADLERRRADLQQQVADLTGPVAPAGEDQVEPTPSAMADTDAALQPNDPSPPNDIGSDAIAASSRTGDGGDRPSTASVERTAVAEPQAPVVGGETNGHVGPFRVFIHVRSADPAARERAEAVAVELRRRGVAVAQIRGVIRPVQRDAVRFYYDADREAVSALQDAVRLASPTGRNGGPQPQDFRGYRAPPKPGTLELWLS